MTQCLDVLVGEKLGQFVTSLDRQDGCDRVELIQTMVEGIFACFSH